MTEASANKGSESLHDVDKREWRDEGTQKSTSMYILSNLTYFFLFIITIFNLTYFCEAPFPKGSIISQ